MPERKKEKNKAPKEKKQKREKKKNPVASLFRWILVLILALVLSVGVLITLSEYIELPLPIPTWEELEYILKGSNSPENQLKPNELEVHFINLGQADSILLKLGQEAMLIDAGENSDGDDVYNYIKRQGIEKLNILVGTHPHSDHIGGLDYIIQNLDVDTIIMPKIAKDLVPTNKTYTDVLKAIKNKGKKVKTATPGDILTMGRAVITILGPNDDYDNLNDYSVCVRVEYRGKSFLFTGDAEAQAENDMVKNYKDLLDIDVLKVGHHGSSTSSSDELMKIATPTYAVIQVGEVNDYGHPHRETLEILEEYETEVYRTDKDGNIIFIVNEQGISIKTKQ